MAKVCYSQPQDDQLTSFCFQYVLRMLGGNGNELESIELLKHFISSCHCNEQGLITKENFVRALSKNELLSQLLSPFT
jgi:hypothetical protein